MPKLKLGAALYALVAIAGVVQVVRIVRHDGPWADADGWAYGGTLVIVALTVFLPHLVRKLQENYYAGQAEASAAKLPVAPERGE